MLIDSSIFLEFLLKQEKAEKCEQFFRKMADGKIQAFLSDFNLDSIIISMERGGISNADTADFVKSLMNCSGLLFYDVCFDDRLNAIDLIKKYKLDYEDALTLQAAISTDSKEILSFDKHFDNIQEVKRIEP